MHVGYIAIVPPLNAAEREIVGRQDSWTVSDEGDKLYYLGFVDTVRDAVEWLDIFFERFTAGHENDLLIDKGYTFDHTLSGSLWLRGRDEDAALVVENSQITRLATLSDPLVGIDWAGLSAAASWAAEQNAPESDQLAALAEKMLDVLRSSGIPEELIQWREEQE